MPKVWMLGDELPHHREAARILSDVGADAPRSEECLFAHERQVSADDHMRDSIEEDRSGTHRAWRKSRIEHAFAVDRRRPSSGAVERIHLAVQDRTALLHTSVVAGADDRSAVD